MLLLRDSTLRECGLQMGRGLLASHPLNRWTLLTQGYLLQQHRQKANEALRWILELRSQEETGYRSVLEDLVSSGIDAEREHRARRMLVSWSGPLVPMRR